MNPFFKLLLLSIVLSTLQLASAQEFQKDIVFAEKSGQKLKLDLLTPTGDPKMCPAIICIHGGGWKGGNRTSYHDAMKDMSKRGYVMATIDYRFTDVAPWPAQIDDVRSARDFLVKNSEKYGIDPERIGAIGESAGGHLSLMLGFAAEPDNKSPRIRSIVNLFGPTDFQKPEKIKPFENLVEALIGKKISSGKSLLQKVSPLAHLDRFDPPVLTFHGTKDKLVTFDHATDLHKALSENKIPNELVPMKDVEHTFAGDVEQNLAKIRKFFDAYLAGSTMPLIAHEDFINPTKNWEMTDDSAWTMNKKNGRTFFSLTRNSNYKPKVRSPLNIALLKTASVSDFVLDVDLRSTHKPYGHQDLCLFFGHQDKSHFYYVHLGRKADAHANSIFLVNGKPRVSIAKVRTKGTDWSKGWHRARITRSVESGTIKVFFDDMQNPIMSTTDKTFTSGRIGIGSFDDKGDFDAIRLWGKVAEQSVE